MKKLLCFGLTALLATNCGNNRQNYSEESVSPGITLKHLAWLNGTWKSVVNNEISYEIWKQENDTVMKGHGFTLFGKDTVFSEKLSLIQKGKDIFYIPAVKDQNKGKAVEFKFMEFNKGEFNFVNPYHGFPQRIIYKNPQPDFLCARIEGTQDGKFRKIDFNFLKVKN